MHHAQARVIRVLSLALCVGSLAASSSAQAQTSLKWLGKAGDKLKYVFTQSTEVKYVTQGQPGSHKSEQSLDIVWTIKSVDKDGTLEVSHVAEKAKMRLTSAGRILEYDSRDKDSASSPELAACRKVYEAMLNQPYTLKISPQGEVVDVKVPDSVIGAVGDTPFADSADSGSFHSVKGVKTTFAQVIPIVPKTPVAPGTSWKSELAIPPTGPLAMTLGFDFRVDSVTPTLVAFHNSIATSITAKSDSTIRVKLNKQSGTGTFTFDPSHGHLLETIINQNVDMTLIANGTEIPQTIVISSSFKLVK